MLKLAGLGAVLRLEGGRGDFEIGGAGCGAVLGLVEWDAILKLAVERRY